MPRTDPLRGQHWKELKRGDHLFLDRIGECEFYKYDHFKNRLETFDHYGVMRYVSISEWEQQWQDSEEDE